jgi:protein-tyrosine phosphatase family protein
LSACKKEYLETALDEMQKRYKTIDSYFSQGLGLDAATIGKLRAKLAKLGPRAALLDRITLSNEGRSGERAQCRCYLQSALGVYDVADEGYLLP